MMRDFWRLTSAAALVAAIAGLMCLGPATAASAAPGFFKVESVDPGQGSTRGGYPLTLQGSGFLPRTITVTLCGAQFTSNGGGVILNQTGTRATFTAPPCTAGATEIAVQSADIVRRVPFTYGTGRLPITGPSSVLTVAGAVMVGAGSLLLLLSRRRTRPALSRRAN